MSHSDDEINDELKVPGVSEDVGRKLLNCCDALSEECATHCPADGMLWIEFERAIAILDACGESFHATERSGSDLIGANRFRNQVHWFFLDFSGKGEVRFRSFDLGTERLIFAGIRSCVQ